MVVETLELPLVVGLVAVEMLRLLLATGPTAVEMRSQPATGLTRLPLLPMVPMATPGVTVAALLSVGNFHAEVFVGVNRSPTPSRLSYGSGIFGPAQKFVDDHGCDGMSSSTVQPQLVRRIFSSMHAVMYI
jgi:hypothetical protein